jgi:4-hydroxymandelate oxidase
LAAVNDVYTAESGGATPASPLVTVGDYERAFAGIDSRATAYVNAAEGDAYTARWNSERYAAYRLLPRTCVDVSQLDTAVNLLGTPLSFPVFLSPTAGHRLLHPDGEVATAQGAAAAEALWVVSTRASLSLEELSEFVQGPFWFQLYMQRDRDFTGDLVGRATDAGARAIVLTVDTPVEPLWNADARSAFVPPGSWRPANLRALNPDPADSAGIYSPWLEPGLTWPDVQWLAEISTVPVIVKGILRPDDARRAVDHGAAAVIVSNHGGRNIDTVVATIDALAPIVSAVADRVPVLVDGGIRRGTDILKAIALGATAAGIGRPYLWGLAVGGGEGVTAVLELLRRELATAMAQSGAPALADITSDLVVPPH